MSKAGSPIRVLHAFGSLNRGGIETWLMNILRLGSADVQFDFILTTPGGVYEEKARGYGCKIHYAPPIRQLGRYLEFLKSLLARERYDVLHVHGEEFMGDAMKVAAEVGVPVRVAHSHNTQLARGKRGFEMWLRGCRHRTLDRSRILKYATDVLACSSDAGRFLMGDYWGKDRRCQALYCGVPLYQIDNALTKWTKAEFRRLHGIPEDAVVVGHAGSMGPSRQKNHPFIIDVFAELAQRDQRYWLYLAGDGPHRPGLMRQVEALGLESRVIMPGLVEDVPSLMVHGFDVHLLPSLWEGLPVVGLEAVASGLYTVCSDTITKDYTDYFTSRVNPVPLDKDLCYWADRLEDAVEQKMPAQQGIELVEQSPFSIVSSTENLIALYKSSLAPHRTR